MALTTSALTLTALAGGGLAAASASAAPAAAPSSVTLFPTDALTVADPAQVTGRRVALPADGCGSVPACGAVARIDELDGFDLDPRLALHFDAPVDVQDVIASTTLTGKQGPIGIDRVVYDPASNTVYAHPARQLAAKTTFTLKVSAARGLPAASTTFTTLSAADGLFALRKQLDTGRAFADAGIAAGDRGLKIDAVVPTDGTTFTYNAETTAGGDLQPVPVPALAPGQIVFGSYLAPSWLRPDRTIAQLPSGSSGPSAVRAERLPFLAVLPNGKAPAGGWPTAIFGHGFTRSDGDVLIAALTNAGEGVATIGTDVVGHGYGPRSTWSFTRAGKTTTVPAYARGTDLDGNGTITSTEGSSTLPTGEAAAVGSRDGLRQTAADVMTLLRAVGRGLDVTGTPASELKTSGISYFGQSFGGIYGTMVTGVDPLLNRSVLNVAGGPITEIARLSPSFRPLIAQSLQAAGLLNSQDPDKVFFDESLPLRGQGPVLDPAPGALPIQAFLAATTWLDRPGSPEAFAPFVPNGDTLFQVAFGDQTVPNPTAYTLLDAGGLFNRASLYRNDRTASADKNPHGFLLDPVNFTSAFLQGQTQVLTFLKTGRTVDPDGNQGVWQVPAPKDLLLPLNYTSPTFPNG